jgi:organic radical activating enzyme
MTNIVSVEPIEKVVSLTWMLGSRCNYDCMYCPTELHDSTSVHTTLDTLKKVWDNFYNKTSHMALPYKISFTGGEVTTNKNFLNLVEYIKHTSATQVKILFTTNGSAGMSYYARASKLVDSMSFSTHSEFINEEKFFAKAELVNKLMPTPHKSFHVNIMDEHWNQDRIKLYQQFLERRHISYSINSINYSSGTRSIPIMKGEYNLVA